jgi:MerR family transcriptional regulator, redox-sensitive transcriptional activator SoxR
VGLLIGEVAWRSGLSTSALRFYERAGLLQPPARVSKRRVYETTVLGEDDPQ